MGEKGKILRDYPVHDALKIHTYIRVSILIDRQSSRSMSYVYV